MTTEATVEQAGAPAGAEQTRTGPVFRPTVDILEHENELTVLADLPGATKDEIDIKFEDGELTIHARVKPRHDDVQFLHREYGAGDFYRMFRVSEQIDPTKISAEFGDGVLTLHLPKAEAAKPRKISIN